MRRLRISIPVTEKSEDELTTEEAVMLSEAKHAALRSYCPYSHFAVGAAAQLENGVIVTGNNQENCAYPSGTCAERTTVFYANSRYPGTPIVLLCVVARDESDQDGDFTDQPIPPCGSCRQVLLETEKRQGKPMRIMLYGRKGIYFVNGVRHLLPLNFDSSFLK